jgi:type I restriction enzyme M protein
MRLIEHASESRELWSRLDQLRDRGMTNRPVESLLAPLAALLLLKWAEHRETEQEAIAAFEGVEYRAALKTRLRWSSWHYLPGEQLQGFLRSDLLPGIRTADGGMLAHTMQRLVHVVDHLAHEDPEVIESLLKWSGDFDVETPTGRKATGEALGALVEYTARRAAKTAGEFTTPLPIVELMVDLIDPRPGDRIYDPCFGTGGLLAMAASRLRERASQIPPSAWDDVQQRSIFGVEINPMAYAIGLARVVFAGVDQPGLELANALERPLARDRASEGFDCILAVPPWGGRVRSGIEAHFPVPATNIETLFLQHVMASLKRGGRAVIALPEGVLFRTGPDKIVRKELLSEYCVDTVIALPEGAFLPYTAVKTSLLLFRRDRPPESVRFLQVQEWPSVRLGDSLGLEKAVSRAQDVADTIRAGRTNGDFWETPIRNLATRDWELVAKRTGEEALSRALKAIQDADTKLPVRPLGEVAEVFAGVSYGIAGTTTHADDESVFAGLLRVGDVTHNRVRAPSLFLTKEAGTRVRPNYHLRPSDVLLTTSGTIGKVGMVSELAGTIGAVPAKSLVVIRPSELLGPQFLKCLLTSDAYQEWFRGHARGATIQHLSVRTLRQLQIPVPELPIQERVVRLASGDRGEPLGTLLRILADRGEDPIVAWLEGSPEAQELRRPRPSTDRLSILERAAHAVQVLRNQVAHDTAPTLPELAPWIHGLAEAVATLRGLTDVPTGPGRLAILDSALLRLEQVHSTLGESLLPVLDTAREITKGMSQIVRAELESILEDVRLEPSVEPSIVVTGAENEVQVRLRNLSSLALRNIIVSTSPDVGSSRLPYLAEGETLSLASRIPARADTGPFQFRVQWKADRLDGRPISGEMPMAVDVRSTREAVHLSDLGTSPYIVGSPIDREEMFFGRQDIIDKIKRQFSASHRANVILLEGNRRTGKTSILKRLQAPNILPGWIVVNCSFQGGEGHDSKAGLPTNEVFRLMAREIGWASEASGLRVWLPNAAPPDRGKAFRVAFTKALGQAFSGDRPLESFELYLQAILEAASPRRLLLMLDEFNKLQEGIDAGITSPQVPENIRYLLHTYPSLSALLVGTRRLKRLREEYWSALFGLGHRIPVGALSEDDALLLVTRPVDGRLTYVPEARDRVVELCARQPFLIQSLCNRIFEHAALSGQRTVTVSAVQAAAEEMVADNEHFRTLWDYAETERRRFILASCERLEAEPDPITLSLLETKLEESGIALPREDRLGDDIEFLRELELLDLRGTTRGSSYVLAIPLMGDWIRMNVDFEDQRQKAIRESEDAGYLDLGAIRDGHNEPLPANPDADDV